MNCERTRLVYYNAFSKCKCRVNHTCVYEYEDWNDLSISFSTKWKRVREFSSLVNPQLKRLSTCYEMCPFCTSNCKNSLCPNYPKHRPLFSCQNSDLSEENIHAPLSREQRFDEPPTPELNPQYADAVYFHPEMRYPNQVSLLCFAALKLEVKYLF